MRISDWSSDVCSSDLSLLLIPPPKRPPSQKARASSTATPSPASPSRFPDTPMPPPSMRCGAGVAIDLARNPALAAGGGAWRSEEHTSELQSLMRISYAVFCLKQKTKHD